MRPEHKPVLHLKQWDSIIRQLTNYNPDTERPLLYLKRDALLTVEEERTVSAQSYMCQRLSIFFMSYCLEYGDRVLECGGPKL